MGRNLTVRRCDAVLHQALLEGVSKKFSSPIGLDALNGVDELFGHLLQKIKGIGGGFALVKADNLEARAVINGRVLVETRRNFAARRTADVELQTVARHGPGIANHGLLFSVPFQGLALVAEQNAGDRGRRQAKGMVLKQMGADAQFAQVEAFTDAKHQTNHFFGSGLSSQPVWPTGVVSKALSVLPLEPAVQRRAGDATAAGSQTDRAELLVDLQPGLPRLRSGSRHGLYEVDSLSENSIFISAEGMTACSECPETSHLT